jgi:hypothetical protein
MWGKFSYCVLTTDAENAMEDEAEADGAEGALEAGEEIGDDVAGGACIGEGVSDLASLLLAAGAPPAFACGVASFIIGVADAIAAMIAFAGAIMGAVSAALSAAFINCFTLFNVSLYSICESYFRTNEYTRSRYSWFIFLVLLILYFFKILYIININEKR